MGGGGGGPPPPIWNWTTGLRVHYNKFGSLYLLKNNRRYILGAINTLTKKEEEDDRPDPIGKGKLRIITISPMRLCSPPQGKTTGFPPDRSTP